MGQIRGPGQYCPAKSESEDKSNERAVNISDAAETADMIQNGQWPSGPMKKEESMDHPLTDLFRRQPCPRLAGSPSGGKHQTLNPEHNTPP